MYVCKLVRGWWVFHSSFLRHVVMVSGSWLSVATRPPAVEPIPSPARLFLFAPPAMAGHYGWV